MATKKTSRQRGRPRKKAGISSKSDKIRTLLRRGMKPADIARQVGSTVQLVYNVKARDAAGGGGGGGRGPGRPRGTAKARGGRRAAGGGTTSDLAGIVAAVHESERELVRLRGALERMQAVVADALA